MTACRARLRQGRRGRGDKAVLVRQGYARQAQRRPGQRGGGEGAPPCADDSLQGLKRRAHLERPLHLLGLQHQLYPPACAPELVRNAAGRRPQPLVQRHHHILYLRKHSSVHVRYSMLESLSSVTLLHLGAQRCVCFASRVPLYLHPAGTPICTPVQQSHHLPPGCFIFHSTAPSALSHAYALKKTVHP